MWSMIREGGPLMYLILLCSIVAVTVIIERIITLSKAQVNVSAFMEKIVDAVRRNRIMAAIEMCDRTSSPVASMIKAGLLKQSASRQEIKEAMEEAAHLYPEGSGFSLADDPYAAAEGADALVLMTEWKLYWAPDFDRLRQEMQQAVIVDGRNIWSPPIVRRRGFTYYAIGRP